MNYTAAIAGVGGMLLVTGCASLEQKEWYRQTRDTTHRVAGNVAAVTNKALTRMQGYLERKEVLKTFQDAGEHGEAAVLAVLQKAGVGNLGNPSPAQPGSHKAPAAAKTPDKASAVPGKYAGAYRWPLDAGIVSSEYGPRGTRQHRGIDIAADVGEPVHAAAAGEVIYSGSGLRGYGNVIIVRHDNQVTTLYAHNSVLHVQQGAHVSQGELIGDVGNTGRSTGPHLHFELRQGEAAVDPRSILPQSKLAGTFSPR